ncbi:hypothetical protein H2200_011971 [Cladophialophora chaetospira]|uniref:Xylanolytic transcriptional activator regulatory domain-containing protein n=1 Tax=Cladophialophora chaetospira TaxID=386627 RepID=A0AA39CD06_9EURO|nr:hypothetical protein H2200_011971 [Cladophialophora chaetospira]
MFARTRRRSPFAVTFAANHILASKSKRVSVFEGGTDGPSDTLLRHSRIHKVDVEENLSSRKATSNETVEVVRRDESSTSGSSAPPAVNVAGAMNNEHLTPASHATTASHPHAQQEDVELLQNASIPGFTQVSTKYPMPVIPSLQSERYSVTPLDHLHPSSSMLPSPPVGENDAAFVTNDDPFSFDDPLGGSGFEEIPGYGSTHWLLEDDFDFTIFENLGFSSAVQEPHFSQSNGTTESLLLGPPQKPRKRPPVSDLRKIWYIQVPDDEPDAGSGTITPSGKAIGPLDDIDETYRDKLAVTLRPPIRDEPLPSIEFLNLCIHLFFTRFNVVLPLIHSPTFRPQHSNSLLVLSICSAGCLAMGSETAANTGAMIFERVNKAILVAPWERVLPRTTEHTWNITKAAMIGQTYALTSADPAHRATAAAYHGSMIALARHHRLLSQMPEFVLDDDLTAEQLDTAWRKWVKQEELKRVAVLLYIHDAEIAALFHHEPVFRHNAGYIPTVCSHDLFSAPSAASWAALYRAQQCGSNLIGVSSGSEPASTTSRGRPHHRNQARATLQRGVGHQNMFNVYNSLAGISASVIECRHLDLLSTTTVNKFESDLLTWYSSTPIAFKMVEHSTQAETPFSLLPLWHFCFMSLSTNLNLLESASGREGSEVATAAREYVLSWSASPDSKRCLLHALLLQNLIVRTNIGALVAIHTPRVLFSAALCWYCYILYSQDGSSGTASAAPSDGLLEPLNSLPEIQLLRGGTAQSSGNFYPIFDETLAGLRRILAANPAEMKASTLCVIESILRRLGTGGISICFADIIQVFISGTAEKSSNEESAT